jgi:hypothetical protein
VPIASLRTATNNDHQRERQGEAERLGGIEIDDQLHFPPRADGLTSEGDVRGATRMIFPAKG